MAEAIPELIADGKWGRFTQSAYDRVPSSIRSQVDVYLDNMGTSAIALFTERYSQKMRAQQTVVPSNVMEAIQQAADEAGLPFEVLRGFAKIESNFNPKAANGSSRGLMQMQPGAWADVKSLVPGLPRYEEGVFDPLQNARAGAAYIKLNQRRLRKAGYTGELSPAVAYLAHQQGAGGFIELWRASLGNVPPTTNYVGTQQMRGNPPQDGKGVTYKKKEFFDRWLKVAQAKTS
jgi:hypothetical protein